MPSAKAAAAIRASLGRLFGSEVGVYYYDAADPAVVTTHAGLFADLAAERLPLPVVLLDGDVIFSGTIEPLRVVAAVAEARQRRGTTARQ